MNGANFLATSSLGGSSTVLSTMGACLILLAVRAVAQTVRLTLTRRVSLYLDGVIVAFFVLFVAFVIIRFRSLA